jgi:hypothetical protein
MNYSSIMSSYDWDFDESGYEWNPFLCGPSSQKNYSEDESPSQPMPGGGHEYDDLINMNVFYVSFGVSCTTVALTIAVILCVNPL